MKKLYLIIILFCCIVTGYAQTASDYVLTTATGTYVSIAGTTGVTTASLVCDECVETSIPIGFTFKFCGVNYTQLSASANGTISLANFGTTQYVNVPANIPGAGFLMPFWDDLDGRPNVITPASYYLTTGSAPNRVFTFEWKDFRNNGSSNAGNFQVKLYETSNIVEFIYGASTLVPSATIGIANSTSDWLTLPNAGVSPSPSSSTFTTSISSSPASGQIYRWQLGCYGFSSAAAINATVSSGCATYSSLLSLSNTPLDEAGLTYQWKTSPTSLGPWTNIPGATTDTYTASVTSSIYYTCYIYCTISTISQSIVDLQLVANDPAPIAGPDTACLGTPVTVTDATPGGTWSSTNTAVATISSGGVLTPVTIGLTSIIYSHLGCFATKNIYVNTVPNAGSISGSYYVCPTPINFSETTTGGTWGITNPSIAGVSTTGAVFAIAPGLDTVTYSVTNGCGTSKAIFPINTTPCLNGVEEVTINALSMEIYPNPNNGTFTINNASGRTEVVNVTVTDLLGRQVKQVAANTNSTTTIKTDLPKGMYFITASTAQGTRTSKLIVE